MIKRKPGRPKQHRLVTLDTAVEEIKKRLMEKFGDERIVERKSYTIKTLYNFRSDGTLTKHGDRQCALVDLDEVLEKLVG